MENDVSLNLDYTQRREGMPAFFRDNHAIDKGNQTTSPLLGMDDGMAWHGM